MDVYVTPTLLASAFILNVYNYRNAGDSRSFKSSPYILNSTFNAVIRNHPRNSLY